MNNDFIQGQRFREITDFVFTPEVAKGWAEGNYDGLKGNFSAEVLKAMRQKVVSVYTHGIYARDLMKALAGLDKEFVVVTHNSDEPIDDSYVIPATVRRWFAQNVATDNPRVESIPIGLENDMWGQHWHPPVDKKAILIEKQKEEKHYRNLCYMNFNPATAPIKRDPVWELFKDKPWVTAHRGSNFSDFNNYIDNVRHHKYVLCPEGNGMDTHRTWETLYLGNIPVEKINKNNRFYTDLPILLVDDWEEVTEELLRKSFWKMKLRDWNDKKLEFWYWKNKIKEACK